MVNPPIPPLDFEANEQAINRNNLAEVAAEVAERSDRLATRIQHFSEQFGILPDDFWRELQANPTGPLAATLAKEARRQNIHERAAAAYVRRLPHVAHFDKLKSRGPEAVYITGDGQIATGAALGNAQRPSKSIDFRWQTGRVTCYAAQKYTREGGGNQDSQFIEMETLLRNFQPRRNNAIALFVLVDGPYYTEARLAQLRGLVRLQTPFSYVTNVNELQPILQGMIPP